MPGTHHVARSEVHIGGTVDETTPTAASEGDARNIRVSAQGDVMAQPAFEGSPIADSSGEYVQGPAASDAAASGNPVQIGGVVDDTTPASAGEGDVRNVRVSPQGNLLVEPYYGNGSVYQAASVDASEGITTDQEATVPAAAGLRLVGWTARESAATAAAATFGIMNGATVLGGTNIFRVELTADQSAGEWYGPEGIDVSGGLTIDVIAGTVDVYLYHKTIN